MEITCSEHWGGIYAGIRLFRDSFVFIQTTGTSYITGENLFGWRLELYETIYSDNITIDDYLLTWLQANATKQGDTVPTTITYNGTETTLEEGKTATLECAGKKTVGNIVVAFGGAGSITYDGSATEAEAGKTATLQCADKKMKSDVYITMSQ